MFDSSGDCSSSVQTVGVKLDGCILNIMGFSIYESRIFVVSIEEYDSSRQGEAAAFFLCSRGGTVTKGAAQSVQEGGGEGLSSMDVSLARVLLFRDFLEERIQVLVHCHPQFRVSFPDIYQCIPWFSRPFC